MAFALLETEIRPPTGRYGSISYARRDAKHGRAKRPTLVISIPTALCSNFKPKDTATFGLQIGTGDDAGKARILAAADGAKPSWMKWAVRFNFGYVPMLGDDAAAKESLTVRPLKDGFEIDLPPWFKPSGQSVGPPSNGKTQPAERKLS